MSFGDVAILSIVVLAAMLVVYHHLVYPALMRRAGRRWTEDNASLPALSRWPSVEIIVPVYNEAAVIADKIRNLAAADYPTASLRVTVVCDGCDDNSAELARRAAAEPESHALALTIEERRVNRGKVAVLNEAVAASQGEIVVLSDASALLAVDALRRIACAFREPEVGIVAGGYVLAKPGSKGEAAYWSYQAAIKRGEAAMGVLIGAHGAFYALRRSLFRKIPADTINDDFVLPMDFVARGARALYRPSAVAIELESADLAIDWRRRRRIAAGNLQQLIRQRRLLSPRFGAVAFGFASGKGLRGLMPFLMAVLVLGSAALAPSSPLFAGLFLLQIGGYGAALLRTCAPQWRLPAAVDGVLYLAAGHAAGLAGAGRYILGIDRGRWRRASQPTSPEVARCAAAPNYVSLGTRFAKRSFDLIVASIMLAATLPAWPLIALAIKLDSRGPVFFRQMRIGRASSDRTRLFMMIKFRSMRSDAEAQSGAVWAAKNDPRITRVGRLLRKTRLDELPQLFNVIAGDMSLVGPRPERPGIFHKLDDAIPFYAERVGWLRPGITGLAQVNQGYDETLDDVRRKVGFDHAYALMLGRFTTWAMTDVAVLLRTFAICVGARGR